MDRLEKSPKEVVSPELQKVELTHLINEFQSHSIFNPFATLQSLLLLEEQEGSVNFKFGVLYAKAGQGSDDEMFSNGRHITLN
jgi:hypothetical protein